MPRIAPTKVNGEATFGGEHYRYCLRRGWSQGPQATFILLNPSTTAAKEDDLTVRRCIRLAQFHGFGSLLILNLFAYRSTDPKQLQIVPDPVGPRNDQWLLSHTKDRRIIVAWGDRAPKDRVQAVLALIGMEGLECFGYTKSGKPRHPLFTKGGTRLIPFQLFGPRKRDAAPLPSAAPSVPPTVLPIKGERVSLLTDPAATV